MNLNELAKAVCEIEGGKVNLSIAEVKQVISSIGLVLMRLKPSQLLNLFSRVLLVAENKSEQ